MFIELILNAIVRIKKNRKGKLLFLILFLLPLSAQSADSVFLEELTSIELQAAIDAGKTTVIIPTGGTEQNGPHIVLGKHNFRIKIASERIAEAIGNTIVAPVVAYTPEGRVDLPSGHMLHAGTLTIPPTIFGSLLEYTARSLKLHGFTTILLIGDSGPNQPVMEAVANKLNSEWNEGSRVLFVSRWYTAGVVDVPKLLQFRNKKEIEIDAHAGLLDTALSLYMTPEAVRTDEISVGKGIDVDGVVGDPTLATKELGEFAYNTMFDAAVKQIKEFMKHK